MMTDIYAQRDAAFAKVEAYLVMKGADRVAKVGVKHGASVTVYFHQVGSQMVRARADGGGYDRTSAAIGSAIIKLEPHDKGYEGDAFAVEFDANRAAMQAAVPDMDSRDWRDALQRAGFTVFQAI